MATIILILTAAFIVWFQAVGSPLGGWFGVKADLLPSLMVYAGLTVGVRAAVGVGILAALMQDSLSVMPMGMTVLPLCVIGLLAHQWQAYLSREEVAQQLALGAMATFVASVAALLALAMKGQGLDFSPWLFVRLLGVTLVGAITCPIFFAVLDRVNRLLGALPPKYERQTAVWNFQKFRHKSAPPERVRERAYK